MTVRKLVEMLMEQDPDLEVLIVAESVTEKEDYVYDPLKITDDVDVVYIETDYANI